MLQPFWYSFGLTFFSDHHPVKYWFIFYNLKCRNLIKLYIIVTFNERMWCKVNMLKFHQLCV